ncbi:MAG: class I SAM-dependent methyltransferase [Candidatus Omnitrophota bacterium]
MSVPYICPSCDGGLREEKDKLICFDCSEAWKVRDSVPFFIKDASYWGEVPREKMKEIVENAKKGDWKDAVNAYLGKERVEYITDESRGWWQYLLPSIEKGKVLDVGAGWGTISFSLAKAGYEVVAVDSVEERAVFIDIRRKQEGMDNVQVACASALELPFPAASFDIVILNGVLEWVGLSDLSTSPDKVQKKVLDNCFRLLKPGGVLYLAIENRISLTYFMGFKDPHSGLKFTTLMPRMIANLYSRVKSRTDYRTYTYTKGGYEKMLRKARFRNIEFFLPLPSYRNFKIIVPSGKGNVERYCATHVWNKKRLRQLRLVQPFLKFLPVGFIMDFFSPDYSIIAKK